MKIALLGDLHLGKTLYGFDLTPYIQRAMWDFFDFSKLHKVDAAIQLGDVFDRSTPTEMHRKIVSQWCNEFERAQIPLFILAGNHDVMARGGSPSALEYLKAGSKTSNPWIVDRPLVLGPNEDERTNANLIFLPFPSPGIYDGAREYWCDVADSIASVDGVSFNLFFAHLNVEGAKLGNQEFMYRGSEYSIPNYWKHDVFCGHIHKPQTVGEGIEILGAAERLRFDESGQSRMFGLIETNESYPLSNDAVTFKRWVRPFALNLVEIEIDASGMNNPSKAPDTNEVIDHVAEYVVNSSIVKLTPFVDHNSAVCWHTVQQWLYSNGAKHVHLAPVVRVTSERKRKKKRKVRDPEKAAKRFIKTSVKEKEERIALVKAFRKGLSQVSTNEKGSI